MVSFAPQPRYAWGKSPQYPLERKLGGLQNWSEQLGEEKILAPAGANKFSALYLF
jgi:hypothetical protein